MPYRRFLAVVGRVILFSVGVMVVGGCIRGPHALRQSRVLYNQAIQATTEEQLLLNLVRLRYRDAPLFLEVGSVSVQFEFDQSVDVAASIVENVGPQSINPTTFNLGAKLRRVEKPTITFTPLQGEDFVERLLAPLSLDTIVLLNRSGWSIDRVLRLTTQGINGVDNARSASGPTPSLPPSYEQFAKVSWQLRVLQIRGWAELGYETRPVAVGPPISGALGVADLIGAAQAGYGFQPVEHGDGMVLTRATQVVVLSLAPQAVSSDEMAEIVAALNLTPGRRQYDVRMSTGLVQCDQQGVTRDTLDIDTRSLMGILFYLSQAVEAPAEHQEAGLVTVTADQDGRPFDWAAVTGDLLRVRTTTSKPDRAAVAVRHQGHWFYIDDADLTSKSTLALLAQLFALQAGGVSSPTPVLTLPIGG